MSKGLSARKNIQIALFEPDFGKEEEQALLEVIRSGWIAMGKQVEAFESSFAEYVGTRHAIAVNSCTSALHLSYLLAGVGPGDEVIVPSLTFAATANAAIYAGARPVFADLTSEDDWTISPEDVSRKITPRTRAVVVMHYAGYPCDMAALRQLCSEADIVLIEDACHGLGGSIDGRSMGALGQTGCFSFYANKIMTTGEGGMIVTDHDSLAQRARLLRAHGMTATSIDRMRGASGYDLLEVGFNYRLDDLRAALGRVQLGRLPGSLERRSKLVAHYIAKLDEIPGIAIPAHGSRGKPAHYILSVRIEAGRRNTIREELGAAGIQTSLHYPPLHLAAPYRDAAHNLTITESVAQKALSLPLYPSMREADVDTVCDALTKALVS